MLDPPLAPDRGAGEMGGGGGVTDSTHTPTPASSPASNFTPVSTSASVSAPLPAASAATLTQVRGGQAKGISRKCEKKDFREIMTESKANRNILEISIPRPETNPNSTPGASQSSGMSYDDFADFLFDHLQVNPKDLLSFNYSLSNFGNKEVGFMPNVDLTPYVGSFSFHGHTLLTRRQSSRAVRVTFRHVPLNIPDQELLNIIECYGTVTDSVVHYEAVNNPKARGIVNANTRHMEMILSDKKLPNFIWLEGPLEGDTGARITVTYPGQTAQCYNCLRVGGECPGMGKGKLCVEKKTPRMKVDTYMKYLKQKDNFATLKVKYAQAYPLLGVPAVQQQEGTFGAEEEKDELIGKLQKRLDDQEERRWAAEQEVGHLKQEQEENSHVMEQEIMRVRQEQEQKCRDFEQVKQQQHSKYEDLVQELEQMKQDFAKVRQEQERTVNEISIQDEQSEKFRTEQKVQMLRFESQLGEMLATSECFEGVAIALADVSHLADFHLQVSVIDGEDSLIAPSYFLDNIECLVNDRNRERFEAMKGAALKKVLLRKKFADEIVREKSTIFRGRDRTSSASKRKSESDHGTTRSRLTASSSTPPRPSLPQVLSTPPLEQQKPQPRPTTPHPKVREQEDGVSVLGDNTTCL